MFYLAKRLIHTLLRNAGLEVRRTKRLADTHKFVGFEWDTAPVRDAGVFAKTVIDVGAAGGTPPLHELFPDAYFYLIEPLADFRPALEGLLAPDRGEVIGSAVGATSGTATINFNPDVPMQSSLADRTHTSGATQERTITIDTLDNLMAGKAIVSPCVLKIDVEGFERDVLSGGAETLKRVEAVIIEVNGDTRYSHLKGNVASVDRILRDAGFGLENLLNASVGGSEHRYVKKADLLYVRVASTDT